MPPPQVLEPHVPSVEASKPPTPPSEATLAPYLWYCAADSGPRGNFPASGGYGGPVVEKQYDPLWSRVSNGGSEAPDAGEEATTTMDTRAYVASMSHGSPLLEASTKRALVVVEKEGLGVSGTLAQVQERA